MIFRRSSHPGAHVTARAAENTNTFTLPLRHHQSAEHPAPCKARCWAEGAQPFCCTKAGLSAVAVTYTGHWTSAHSHTSTADGWAAPGWAVPATMLHPNNALPFGSHLPCTHTHTHTNANMHKQTLHTFSNPGGRKREILDHYLLTLHIFSLSPFHKTTLLFPSKEWGWELVIFLFQIKGWQKKNAIHVIVFPYCLH